MLVFLNLWALDHWWSTAVRQEVRRRFRKEKKKHSKNCTRYLTNGKYTRTSIHVCDKTGFVDWRSEESTRISSFRNFLSFIHYFRKWLVLVYRKMWYNVSRIHMLAPLGVCNFTKVVRVCAYRLWSGAQLSEVWQTHTHTYMHIYGLHIYVYTHTHNYLPLIALIGAEWGSKASLV
jgi:hypothetical protein